jgi:hypothetical protein
MPNSFYGKGATQAGDQAPMPDFKSMASRIPALMLWKGKDILNWI